MTMNRRRVLSMGGALLATAALTSALPAVAAPRMPAAAKLSDADRESVGRIEQYLNGFKTVDARFMQVSSDGTYAEGSVKIQRPGRLRIDYDPPSKVLIITNGDFLVYWDKAVEQVTHVPINSTPAGLLVRENIQLFSKDLTIVRVDKKSGLLELTLVRTEDAAEGSLTLVFNDTPMALRQWIVTDAQGISTAVTLADARFGVAFNSEVFRFRDPNIFGQPNP